MEIISESLIGTEHFVEVIIGEPFKLCKFIELDPSIKKSLNNSLHKGRIGDFYRTINNLTLSDLPVPKYFCIVTSINLTVLTKKLTTMAFVNKFKANTSWEQMPVLKTYISESAKKLINESIKHINEDQVAEEFTKLFDYRSMSCNFNYINKLLYKKYREYVNNWSAY